MLLLKNTVEGSAMKGKSFTLTYPWDTNGYKPNTVFELWADGSGFHIHITTEEKNPLCKKQVHQSMVCEDSCVEWFVNFQPERCDRYFNFEVNAAGIMYAAFRKDRLDYQLLPKEDIEALNIQTKVNAETWEVQFFVPFELIQKYIPEYQFVEGMMIRSNFYKCGDHTQFPHYGIWKESLLERPDFHRPEFFGEVYLD